MFFTVASPTPGSEAGGSVFTGEKLTVPEM